MQTMNDRNQQFGNLKVLRVDSSARSEGSMSRWVADELIEQRNAIGAEDSVKTNTAGEFIRSESSGLSQPLGVHA
jgi:hypothetical protein